MAIYLTGDTHGSLDIRKLASPNWPEGCDLTRDDLLMILGDFGNVWDGGKQDLYWQRWLESKPWTTLFVDGNHENHDLLATYPAEPLWGGMVHRVQPHVLHLMRGYVFDLPVRPHETQSFLAMGGTYSHDKEWRTEGKSWWALEVPTKEERDRCEKSLAARDWQVDYVLTHDAPAQVVTQVSQRIWNSSVPTDEFEQWLGDIDALLTYRRWFFGHWHDDLHIDPHYDLMYRRVCALDELV